MSWLYKGVELTDEMIPDKSAGFIYIIRHVPSNKRYIGRKLLTKAQTRQKNNQKVRTRVESDWREYWSSSPLLKELIAEEGTDKFVREVLMFADNKAKLNYLEEKFLYSVGALESEDWYNTNIRSKMFKRNILNKLDTEEITSVLRSVQY